MATTVGANIGDALLDENGNLLTDVDGVTVLSAEDLEWAILAPTPKPTSAATGGGGGVFPLVYRRSRPVGADLRVAWSFEPRRVAAELGITSRILASVAAELPQHWAIERVPPNRDFLLTELDPDLAVVMESYRKAR